MRMYIRLCNIQRPVVITPQLSFTLGKDVSVPVPPGTRDGRWWISQEWYVPCALSARVVDDYNGSQTGSTDS